MGKAVGDNCENYVHIILRTFVFRVHVRNVAILHIYEFKKLYFPREVKNIKYVNSCYKDNISIP